MDEKLLNVLNVIDSNKIDSIKEKILSSELISSSDIDFVEKCICESQVNDIDSVLYNVMYSIAFYNAGIQGLQKEKTTDVEITPVVEKTIGWTDILTYLDININEIEPLVLERMKSVTNFNQIQETARFIKNSRKPENRIINKISDVNIVLNLIMYSNKKIISNIISYFKTDGVVDGRALGKAIEAIPSIFLVDAPEEIPSNYDLFIKNYKLLESNDVSVRNVIINKPILMISSELDKLVNSIKEVIV